RTSVFSSASFDASYLSSPPATTYRRDAASSPTILVSDICRAGRVETERPVFLPNDKRGNRQTLAACLLSAGRSRASHRPDQHWGPTTGSGRGDVCSWLQALSSDPTCPHRRASLAF